MTHWLLTLLLGPLLLYQGFRVRRNILLLPEPPGERTGTAGDGPPLRLLVTGDSAAAGVGAAHQQSACLSAVDGAHACSRLAHLTLTDDRARRASLGNNN